MKLHKIIMGSALIVFPLFGEKYFLTSMLYGTKQEVVDSKEAYIVLMEKENRFAGKSLCNNIMGEWNAKKEIKNVASTMMMCSEPEMRVERKILTIFNNSTISFEDKNIVVENKSGKLIFVPKNDF